MPDDLLASTPALQASEIEQSQAIVAPIPTRPPGWPKWRLGVAVSVPAIDSTAAAILALGVGLRLWQLADNSVWFDEAHSLSLASQPTVSLLLEGVVQDLQSPLYFVLLKVWMQWFHDDFGVRLLSVVLGATSLYLVYRLGKALFSVEVGQLATFLLALSSYHIYYSQHLRGYILLATLGLGGALALIWALRQRSWQWWTLYAISTIGILYTHVYGFFVFFGYLPAAIYYLSRHQPAAWRPWLISHFAIAASLGPWIPATLWQLAQVQTGSDPWILPISIHSLQSLWGSLWWMTRDDFGVWPGILFRAGWAALAIALGYGLIVHWRRFEHWFTVSLLLVPPLLIMGASLAGSQSIWAPRYFVFLSGPFALLLASSMMSLPRPLFRTAAIGLFLLISLPVLYTLQNHATFQNTDVRAASAWARSSFQKGDVIVHTNEQSYLPALWYDRTQSAGHGPEAPYEVDCVWRSLPRDWCKSQPYPQLYLDTKWNDLPTLAWYADRIWLLAIYDHRKPGEDLATEDLVHYLMGDMYTVRQRTDYLGVQAFLLTTLQLPP